MTRAYLLSAAILALAGCGTGDDATTPPEQNAAADITTAPDDMPVATPATPTDAAGYVAKAGAGDLFEIDSSKALLSKSNDADVKQFAQMMIEQHRASTETIKAAATKAGVDVAPPALDADQQKMLSAIEAADADSVDAIYLTHQRSAHAAALALHQSFAARGDTDALKQAASEIVPVIEAHRAELDKLSANP